MSSSWLLLDTAAGNEAFDPFARSEIQVGFEADMTGADMTLNVDKVINWGRSSLIQVTQGSDPKRFVRQIAAGDGLLECVCEGTDDEMGSVSNLDISTFSFFTVMRIDAALRVHFALDYFTGDAIWFANRLDDLLVSRGGVISSYNDPAQSWIDNVHHLFEFQFDGTNAGNIFKVDDVVHSWPENPSTGDPGTGVVSQKLNIASADGFFFMNGAWRAGYFASPQLPAEVSAQYAAYLKPKWVTP